MDTSYVLEDWRRLFSSKNSRVELLRQALQHVPPSSSSFSEIQRHYQYYVDNIQEGANNFAEEVLENGKDEGGGTPEWRSTFDVNLITGRIKEEPLLDYGSPLAGIRNITSSSAQRLSDVINKVFKKASDLEMVVRAPVRGGNLLNRRAQFAKISREPIVKENTSLLSVNALPPPKPSPNCGNFKECRPTFISARQQLLVNTQVQQSGQPGSAVSRPELKKTLGSRCSRTAFVPPFARSNEAQQSAAPDSGFNRQDTLAPRPTTTPENGDSALVDERLKQFDQKIIDLIMSEIMDSKTRITWEDIAGLHSVKSTLKEVVIFPMLRPDIFTGLRGPPRGLLLFGPPGTGKTLIGKCIASTSQSTFFSISASSLTSKWVGDGEKMVRALFTVARIHQPSVIFIDEIDSLLSQRSETEHESSRRIKTEFLIQLDGVATGSEDRLLLIGATNRPQELDEAARRRFVKRLYIPLPCQEARREIVDRLIQQQKNNLTLDDLDTIAVKSEGFSGADVANLCREAAMGPIRGLPLEVIQSISCQDVPPVQMSDFLMAFKHVKASVSPSDLQHYLSWNQQYGSFQV
uniref:Fidgetin protein 1 n=1 Tax=Echinococcus granulosus TaxID=6210 RepID=A0A068WB81_ECHGR|nr:fidgetin protein 1 [Echinococcus granulosus]